MQDGLARLGRRHIVLHLPLHRVHGLQTRPHELPEEVERLVLSRGMIHPERHRDLPRLEGLGTYPCLDTFGPTSRQSFALRVETM